MSDEIETIDKNPKSWAAWKREAERLQGIIDGVTLATMDSEPVAIIDQANLDYLRSGADADVWPPEREEMGDVLLYHHAQPAPERDQVRREHAEWSQATFGDVGPVGPLKHLSKEALEAAAEPGDLSEWADIQFLLWDAQRRAGIADEQITQAMIEKLAVNKQREWPEPKDGEPRLHIKAQPAPVVPEDVRQALSKMDDEIIAELDAEESVCRAAMLPAAPVRSSMPDGVVTAEPRRVIEMLLSVCGAAFELADDSCQQDVDGEECHVVPSDAFQKLSDALDEIENTLPTEDIDRPDVFLAWSAMPRAALKSLLQAGKSPAIPDGYVMVPMRLTAENGAKGALSGEFSETKFVNCPECFGDDECETCDGSGRIEITVPVTWTTIKEIWAKGVEHFAAAPQSPGSEPATVPGKWIPVSERMPPSRHEVLVGRWWGEKPRWCCKWATYIPGHPDSQSSGWLIPGASWTPTHWMPLPAAPQEPSLACISKRSQHLS